MEILNLLEFLVKQESYFKGDDSKFTGDLTWSEVGGKKSLIGWLNDKGEILSGYANNPKGTVAGASKDEKFTF